MTQRVSTLALPALKHVWRASNVSFGSRSQVRYVATRPHLSNTDLHRIPPPQSDLQRSVRFLMRSSAHPVYAVVAFADIDPKSSEDEIISKFRYKPCFSGLLVSSLNTVTIKPEPYISFNVKTTGETYRRIREWGRFTATQLYDVSTAYAFAGIPNMMKANSEVLWRPGAGMARDRGVSPKLSSLPQSDNPRKWLRQWVERTGHVKREGGGGAWMRCEFMPDMSTEVGDHCIVVGRVVEVGLMSNDSRNDMFYIHGRYSWLDREKLLEEPAHEEFYHTNKHLDLSETQQEEESRE